MDRPPVLALVLLAVAEGCAASPVLPEVAAPPSPVIPDVARPPPAAPSPRPPPSVEKRPAEPCEAASSVHFFVAPQTPAVGTPLRILAMSDRPLSAELVVRGTSDDETRAARAAVRHGGPPYFWSAEVQSPHPERYQAKLVQTGCLGDGVATENVTVAAAAEAPTAARVPALWETRAGWSHALENLYSAWIETLFDAPDESRPSWDSLGDVLADRERNFLYDFLGAGEDSTEGSGLRPDCADLPYFLRAYFAFKLGLPFGVSECGRGTSTSPPRCRGNVLTNEDRPPTFDPRVGPARNFDAFVRKTLADRVHSGTARVPFDDERSDYYPVPLTAESLRPGTVYADPYGHVLVVAKRLPPKDGRPGVLYAVDAQPDAAVRRKRFWRGDFLYAHQNELGGAGWKRFRPLSVTAVGKVARWSDHQIESSPEYGDLSREQAALGPEEFFDKMDDILAPEPLDPERALFDSIAALEAQIRTRVDSVDSGRTWLLGVHAPAAMPDPADLFEATGSWEDYSTPSRDLRLLIAMDFVAGFPAHVARRPERYAIPSGASPEEEEARLREVLTRELGARRIAYPRTDGSPFTLSLADVLGRQVALEVAYNPNDCAEVRWGAPAGSEEAQTCRSHAPAVQRERMETLRAWFHERRRPPRR